MDEVEVDRLVSDVYVDKNGESVINALVFRCFNGVWKEGVKQTIYISDLDLSIIGPPTAPSRAPMLGMQMLQEQHLYDLFKLSLRVQSNL